MSEPINRRGWLTAAVGSMGAAFLAGCDKIGQDPKAVNFVSKAEGLTRRVQRLVIDRKALAREFTPADISPVFKPNGSISPADPEYRAHLLKGFADYRLVVDGLVERPLALSLEEVRALPSRTQITRHDCVEGWSAIGKWRGARLGPLLDKAGVKKTARYIVFHCADTLEQTLDGSGQYYESIDLIDAYHPQTILAYQLNDKVLPVSNGAPLRLRVERQLGYKQAKYVMRLEAVDRFDHIGGGQGGYWEDQGYDRYGGI
jgi:DMSO/TMAO reductase YedYZ molybdopterin-dependent catalytic subunit